MKNMDGRRGERRTGGQGDGEMGREGDWGKGGRSAALEGRFTEFGAASGP